MDAPASLRFAQSARLLSDAARAIGLRAPGFRCPPRTPGATRALRRAGDHAVIAVRLHGRAFDDVLADMVEGVVRVNELRGEAAQVARSQLQDAVVSLPAAQASAA